MPQPVFQPLVNPVLIAVAIIVATLALTRTDYRTYFDGRSSSIFFSPAVRGARGAAGAANGECPRLAADSRRACRAVRWWRSAVARLAWRSAPPPGTLLSLVPKSVDHPDPMASPR